MGSLWYLDERVGSLAITPASHLASYPEGVQHATYLLTVFACMDYDLNHENLDPTKHPSLV
jgi:hypothetical protein